MSEITENINNMGFAEDNNNLEFKKEDYILSFITVILAFGFVKFVLFNATGFITTALYILIISSVIVFLKKKKFSFLGLNKFIAVILYLFSFVFSITDNHFIKVLDVIFLFGTGAYFIYSVTAQKKSIERFLPFAVMKSLFEYPFSKFGTQPKILKSGLKKSQTGKNILLIITGLVITVPVTAVVASLLMSADSNFESMITGFFKNINSEVIVKQIPQILIAIPCSYYLFGMIYSNVCRDDINILDESECSDKIVNVRFVNNIIVYTALTPICILYLLFFISQANYFLSGFTGNLPEGYTYSEYARRGFFELFAVILINLGIICTVSFTVKNGGRYKPVVLKIYNLALCIFTLVLIATEMSKMTLYIRKYGLTPLRVYTTWFMVLCAVIFLFVIIKQFYFDFHFAKYSTTVFTVMFAVLCFSRPESLIAKYNIKMYQSGYFDELDSYSIIKMSDDAILELAKEYPEVYEARCKNRHIKTSYEKYNISSLLLSKNQ